ncbi:hypothetical protein Peur_062781 [Populus x canadensis]
MLLSWLCFIGLFFFLPSLHFHHNLCCASIVKSFVELFWASFPLDSCFVEIATCLLYSAAVCKSLWAGRVIVGFFLLFFMCLWCIFSFFSIGFRKLGMFCSCFLVLYYLPLYFSLYL